MHDDPSDDLGSISASQEKAGKGPKDTGRNKRQELGGRFTGSSYAFVEDIARQEEANAERREQMHDFFEVRNSFLRLKEAFVSDLLFRCLRTRK